MSLLDDFKTTIVEGLKSNTLTSPYRWACHRRVMTGSEFAGPYSAKYHPWVKEMHDSKASYNYAMKGAQLGVTEICINCAFFALDQMRKDVLYVLPTQLNATDFSKARFSSALKNSPYLTELFTDTNTVSLKQAGNCNLYIRGSRGDSNLKSIPVSVLILDELDEMDQKQVWLALERLSGRTVKTVWAVSTPTVPNYGVHKLYLTSTQEHFVFPCPCCSRWTELIWPDCIELLGESVSDPHCHESYLKCKECGGRLEHLAKPEWLGKATWKVSSQNANPDIRGFHINQLYSFTVTPGEIAVAHHRGMANEAACVEFHNSKIGIPYISDAARVTDSMLDNCTGSYVMDDSRPDVGGRRLITLGIDQGKWSYWTVIEWFMDRMTSDINVAAFAKVLGHGKFHEDDWWLLDQMMPEWQVQCCVIDADPEITEARRFARRFPKYVYLCRYRRGQTNKEISVTEEDSGAPIATVDRTNWITAALGRFRTKRISLPRDTSLEYREHMKSLVRTYEQPKQQKKDAKESAGQPKVIYIETGPDHYAHSLTYAEIALPFAASISTGQNVEKFL
jgi:hypothetical protein